MSAPYYGEAAHPKCGPEVGHVCQELSGRVCIETDCEQAAGTFWGLYWCPDHDAERIDRIGRQMDDLRAGLKPGGGRVSDSGSKVVLDNPGAVLLAIRAAWDRETEWTDFGREVGEIIARSEPAFRQLRAEQEPGGSR